MTPAAAISSRAGSDPAARLRAHVQIFETLRVRTEGTESTASLFERLEAVSGYRLYVVTSRGASALDGLPDPPPDIVEAFAETGPNVVAGPGISVPVWVGGRIVGILIAVEHHDGSGAGQMAVRHIATIASLELGQLHRDREFQRLRSEEVLADALDGVDGPADLTVPLAQHGLEASRGLVLAACATGGDPATPSTLHQRLCEDGVAHALIEREHLYVLIGAGDRERLLDACVDFGCVGMSEIFCAPARASLARCEARWALERAGAGSTHAAFAAEGSAFWLPPDIASLRQLVHDVLGPVIDYDREHRTELLRSLTVYFQHERALAKSAAVLYVHKHTLTYRLKRVEELTGRRLASVADVAQLWLAVKANEIAGADEPARAGAGSSC